MNSLLISSLIIAGLIGIVVWQVKSGNNKSAKIAELSKENDELRTENEKLKTIDSVDADNLSPSDKLSVL